MKSLIDVYMSLEEAIMSLDGIDEFADDKIRDAMDVIWLMLSKEERQKLSERKIVYE